MPQLSGGSSPICGVPQKMVGWEFLQTRCGLLLLRGRFVPTAGLISK
jgi:hypothetical protein